MLLKTDPSNIVMFCFSTKTLICKCIIFYLIISSDKTVPQNLVAARKMNTENSLSMNFKGMFPIYQTEFWLISCVIFSNQAIVFLILVLLEIFLPKIRVSRQGQKFNKSLKIWGHSKRIYTKFTYITLSLIQDGDRSVPL